MHLSNNPSSPLAAGLKRLANGDYQAVHLDSIEMIKGDVSNPVPYFLLGSIAFEHKNYTKAVELFKQAVAYDSSSALYKAHLAKTLTTLNQQTEARAIAESASHLSIQDAHTADTIGVVLSRTGFHELALPLFEKAVSLNPKPANFYYNLGSSLQFLGRFAEAEVAYLSALERDPGQHRAWSSLVSLSRQSPDQNYLETLKAHFAASEGTADACLHYGHAIAKTLEDLGRYEESLTWLKRAKEKKRDEISFGIETELAHFQAARATLMAGASPTGDEDPSAPIFIIGLPRTGTTLVDRILSSHAEVKSAGELNTFAGLIKSAAGTPSNLVLDGETLGAGKDLDLSEIGAAYIRETARLADGAARFTDKMPLNFFYAGLIHQALPNARIVALRRSAMDSCLSNYRQLFATGFSYYNYTFDLQDTASYFRAFDALMAHWRDVIPGNRFLEIRYEDIVFNQEPETRRLLQFCGLEWDPACLRFHENEAPVSTASSVQVRQPLYSGSIDRWKKYGSALTDLQAALGDLASK